MTADRPRPCYAVRLYSQPILEPLCPVADICTPRVSCVIIIFRGFSMSAELALECWTDVYIQIAVFKTRQQ
jgi:hypothetical protein